MLLRQKKGLILPRKRNLVLDVFQSRLRTGSSSARTETVGWRPDLIWSKNRSIAASHYLFDTDRGANQAMSTNATNASTSTPDSVNAFNANGYSVGTSTTVNNSGNNYVDWLFKTNNNFFKAGTFNKGNGVASTIDLSSLGTVGMVVIKCSSLTSDWYTWHRSLTSGNNVTLNGTASQSTTNAYVSVSGTTVSFAGSAPAGTYEYYAWAHQPSGIVACGLGTVINNPDGISANYFDVTLNWNPQFVLVRRFTGTAQNGFIGDTSRGFTSSSSSILQVNVTSSESSSSSTLVATPNGFRVSGGGAGNQSMYLAIRGP